MKKLLVLMVAIVFSLNGFSQTANVKAKYVNEGWDLMWLTKSSIPGSAPENTQQRCRIVSFNLDEFTSITSAVLEYDYADGDEFGSYVLESTTFYVKVDGDTVDSKSNASNTQIAHGSVDVTSYASNRYALPVEFSLSNTSNDGALIGRVYLVVNGSEVVQGTFANEPWDFMWLVKSNIPGSAPVNCHQRGRIVSFNLDEFTSITSASLEYDYADGDGLGGYNLENTTFYVKVDGNTVETISNASNTQFTHSSVDVTSYVSNRYVLPVEFSLSGTSNDGALIGRVYLVVNGTTKIGEYKQEVIEVDLFPNPTSDILNVEMNNAMEIGSYDLIDVSGRVIMTGGFESSLFSIQLNSLARGAYTLNIRNEKGELVFSDFLIKN